MVSATRLHGNVAMTMRSVIAAFGTIALLSPVAVASPASADVQLRGAGWKSAFSRSLYDEGDETTSDAAAGQTMLLGTQMSAHGEILLTMSLCTSLITFLAMTVFVVPIAAASVGVPTPLVAALPSASAALLSLQLIAITGQHPSAPAPLYDLARAFMWICPASPWCTIGVCFGVLFSVCLLRRYALRRHRVANKSGDPAELREEPYGLVPGAWEIRALGVLAFPLARSATTLLVWGDSSGFFIALVTLIMLANVAVSALSYVTEVIADGRVARISLPETASGEEVFVDRHCGQLRGLPLPPPQLGCGFLVGGWFSSASWCVAPTVAAIVEVELNPYLQPDEPGVCGSWCGPDQGNKGLDSDDFEMEDEQQGRPLLNQIAADVDHINDLSHDRDGQLDGARLVLGPSASEPGGVQVDRDSEAASREMPRPAPRRLSQRSSAVGLAHPVTVTTTAAYEAKAHDEVVAGVSCLPWLDCVVPASALRRLEEIGGEVVLQAHPSQLSGQCTSGRYAVCFDWGTRWPWRWPLEVSLQVGLGIWAALPASSVRGAPLAMIAHALVITILGLFIWGMATVRPYQHRADNLAQITMLLVALLVVVLRAVGFDGEPILPGTTLCLCIFAAVLTLIPCSLLLFAAVGMASAVLQRLEVQGLQDRFLPRTVVGWKAGLREGQGSNVEDDGGPPASSSVATDSSFESTPVEVILPGPRPAVAILLPALTRLRVVQSQLLPPTVGRAGEQDSLPPCSASGDKPRLPVPCSYLFSSGGHGSSGPSQASTAPLAALLAPGRQGRLIYADRSKNENGAEWREVVRDFFGQRDALLADEAERIVADNVMGEIPPALAVIEVLPAFAGEFLDEQVHSPPTDRTESFVNG